jgi:flavodoxin/ferredoxin
MYQVGLPAQDRAKIIGHLKAQKSSSERAINMKCLIIYYSLTNATSQIAESISMGLKKTGFDIRLFNIKDGNPPDLQEFDLLGIGTPVYYFQIPINVLECLDRLSNKNKIKSFAFLLNGSYAWNAGAMLKKAMLKRGFSICGWFYNNGAGYFLPYNKLGCLASPDSPTSEDLARAQKFGYDIGTASSANTWPEQTISPPIIYRLEQVMTKRVMIRSVFQKLFYLNKRKCIKCGICIKGCPVHNLNRSSEGFPHWNRSCIMCLSCESHCPENAILSPVNWPVMKPLIKYNVKKIMDDPALGKIKIRHQHGKIEKI